VLTFIKYQDEDFEADEEIKKRKKKKKKRRRKRKGGGANPWESSDSRFEVFS